MRGERAGYGVGSSFLMDFNLIAFTFKTVFKALDCDLHFVQCCIPGNTPTFCAHVIMSNLLCVRILKLDTILHAKEARLNSK